MAPSTRAALLPTDPGLFIDGRFTPGIPRPITNPWGGAAFATVGFGEAEAVEAAIFSAVAAFPRVRGTSPAFRRDVLRRAGAIIGARAEEAAGLLAREAGKPIRLARQEVARAASTFDFAADECGRTVGELVPVDADFRGEGATCLLRRVPVGPIAGIVPFNFPLNLTAHKVAPAIAAGCTIVVKPAAKTPLSALFLAAVVHEAGALPGTVNVVPCERAFGDRLVTDARLRMLSFTGSPAVGWDMKSRAGRKKVTLELGGNAALLIEPDADLDAAAAKAVAGGFGYAGQSCISVQRIYVQRSVLEPFRARLLERTRALRVGDPLDEATDVGPLIDDDAAARVEAWIREATAAGARLLLGGRREGRVIEPTVLESTRPDMKVSCEEVFGPVVTLDSYDRFEEAVAWVNESRFGLQAGLFTRDLGRILDAADRLEVGGLMVNEAPTFRIDLMPYGGVKDSGLGREGPRSAIEAMTEPRVILLGPCRPQP